jgi:hypothetical protein
VRGLKPPLVGSDQIDPWPSVCEGKKVTLHDPTDLTRFPFRVSRLLVALSASSVAMWLARFASSLLMDRCASGCVRERLTCPKRSQTMEVHGEDE